MRGRGGLEGAARATLATHRLPTESSSVTTLIFRESALVATPRIMQMLGWCSFVMSATSCAKPSIASLFPFGYRMTFTATSLPWKTPQ